MEIRGPLALTFLYVNCSIHTTSLAEAYFFSKLSMYSFFFLLLSWAEICNGRGDERITLQLLSVRDNRGWDGWVASPTQWTRVRVNSENCDRQGGLACCSPWGCKELDTTQRLNDNIAVNPDDWSLWAQKSQKPCSLLRPLPISLTCWLIY